MCQKAAQAIGQALGVGAEQAAAATGLAQRLSKLTGSVFTPTLVCGWLTDPDASLSSLTRMAATLGAQISPQALFQGFTPQAAECLYRVWPGALTAAIAAEPVAVPVLQRFSAVLVIDRPTIVRPDALREVGRAAAARFLWAVGVAVASDAGLDHRPDAGSLPAALDLAD